MSIEWLTCQPRHWPRYGDGNWLVMGRAAGKNCDGHSMRIKGMAAQVRETVARPKKGIDYALTEFAKKQCPGLIETYASKDIAWTNGDILTDAVVKGRMALFSAWLLEHNDRMAWIGPRHLENLPRKIKGAYHLRMGKDCWKETDMVVDMLRGWAHNLDVVLFASSFLTCCAVYALHAVFEGKWIIDVGSSMDPLCGAFSRAYHRPKKRGDGMTWPEVYGF